MDADYKNTIRVWEDFGTQNIGEYHNLHMQTDTLRLADVFKNLRSKCIEIYELDTAKFLLAPELAYQSCLKKKKVELELLTNDDVLQMKEKGISSGIWHVIHQSSLAKNKYLRDMPQTKSCHISCIGM